MTKINWISFVIMVFGIGMSILSIIADLDLMFIAGILFGVGLSNLTENKK